MLALKHWDRERGFIKPVSEIPLADLYVCWDRKAIYLGLYAQDVVENTFYRDKIVRVSDRAEWIISSDGFTRPIRARLGAGLEPIVNEKVVRLVNISGVNGDVRNIACVELPVGLFGKSRFRAGDKIDLTSSFFTHCRGYRVDWRGKFELKRANRECEISGSESSSSRCPTPPIPQLAREGIRISRCWCLLSDG